MLPGSSWTIIYNPAISPDASKVAYVVRVNGMPQLFMSPLEEGADYITQVQLTSAACSHEAPSWSPDGRSLVWMADCDGDVEIYHAELVYSQDRPDLYQGDLHVALSSPAKLTDNHHSDQYPRYSPDGSRIAFQSNRDGNEELYLMSADGSGQSRLSSHAAADQAPTWSFDGTRLAFASNRDGDFEIYTMDMAGRELKQLTNNTSDERWPVWFQ